MTDLFWEFVKYIMIPVAGLVLLSMVSTPFVFVYWFFNPDAARRCLSKHEGFAYFVYGCTSTVFSWIVFHGIRTLFTNYLHVPQDWAFAVGILFTVATIVFLVYVFSIFEKVRVENQSMKTELEIVEKKKRIKDWDENRLKEECTEYKQRLKELAQLEEEKNRGLTTDERYERYKLEELLRVMNYEMERRTLSQDNQEQ